MIFGVWKVGRLRGRGNEHLFDEREELSVDIFLIMVYSQLNNSINALVGTR